MLSTLTAHIMMRLLVAIALLPFEVSAEVSAEEKCRDINAEPTDPKDAPCWNAMVELKKGDETYAALQTKAYVEGIDCPVPCDYDASYANEVKRWIHTLSVKHGRERVVPAIIALCLLPFCCCCILCCCCFLGRNKKRRYEADSSSSDDERVSMRVRYCEHGMPENQYCAACETPGRPKLCQHGVPQDTYCWKCEEE
eukprot:TRINITY_DN75195_c0_g1_i1.p2 TRINITY_DN75195_c0_g1~~TRINITY_DN75195_c0_g1_i1.p2  ORF type:complete len:216 (+),score=39.58 TRINITY_DN75195_c0_g1_i1:58-648(+)